MAVFNEPTKWQTSLVNSGDANTIPQNTPAGTGEASFEEGFPQITQVPIGAGGQAPDRKDFNGLFKVLGDWIFFLQNGGLSTYSANFDYVVGRYVVYNNTLYKCIQANGASSTVVAPDSVSPLGSDYWKDIENQDTTSLIPNQLIISPVPLTDANLHLLDGALLSGSGAYSEYVTMMGALHDADPTATCWTDEATWQASVTTYGECGKFVYDSVNNTLRLPKVVTYIMATNTATELGSLVEAGLPNIKSDNTNHFMAYTGETGSYNGALKDTFTQTNVVNVGTTNGGSGHILNFDASIANSIYGNSPTVQTQAIKYYHYIVVGTVSKTDIQIDIDNVLTDLNGKADTDLSNLSASGLNKFADPNLSNVSAPVQAFKDMSVSWGMPDYDSAIDISSQITTVNNTITIAQDSYLKLSGTSSSDFVRSLLVNDEVFLIVETFAGNTDFDTLPIPKGTYQMKVNTTGVTLKVYVIPCKGEN